VTEELPDRKSSGGESRMDGVLDDVVDVINGFDGCAYAVHNHFDGVAGTKTAKTGPERKSSNKTGHLSGR